MRVNETATAKLRGLIAAFGVGAGGKVLVAVRDAVRTQNQYVIGRLGTYNRGKGPFPVSQHRLGHVSGNWRLRMNSKESIQGTQVRAAIVNEMEYAAAHEFGFRGAVNVRAKARRQRSRNVGKSGRLGVEDKSAVAFGFANVKSFTRQANIPARAPITHGIEKHIPKYETALSNAIIESVDATWRGLR
jgi:hypothetical protein